MTHYEILEVSSSSTQQEIKKAYRKLARRYHPDINPSEEAKLKMRQINGAYEMLSDLQTRKEYDQYLGGETVYTAVDEVSEREKYKRAYAKWRHEKEQARYQSLLRAHIWFYKVLRLVNFPIFLLGLILTVDYYYLPSYEEYNIERVSVMNGARVIASGGSFAINYHMAHAYRPHHHKKIRVYKSSVLKADARLEFVGSSPHPQSPVMDSLYVFNNVFTIIMLAGSTVVLLNRTHNDFRLTAGIVPLFSALFIILYVTGKYNFF